MATDQMTLPKGFVLDQKNGNSQLPQGFVVDKPAGGISGKDIVQHPFQSVFKTVIQPAEQSLTGRSIEDKTRASLLKKAGNVNFKGKNPSEVKNELGDIQDDAFKKTLLAQSADMASTPSNYVGAGLVKGAAGLVKSGVQGVGKLAKYESGRLINSLIKPAEKAFLFGKNPGQQVVKEGITSGNIQELGEKITGKLNEAQKDLQTTLKNPKLDAKIDDYSDAIKPIESAIEKAKRLPKVNGALIKRLEDAKSDLSGVDSLGNPTRDLRRLTPSEAVQLKRDIGDATKWTKEGGSDEENANKALKQAYGKVKERIEKNVPGIKAKNDRLANLIDAEVAVKRRDRSLQKADMMGGIFEKVTGLGGLMEIARGDFEHGLEGIGLYGIKKIMDSPLAKTHVAQWLNKLSESDLAKALNKFPQLKRLVKIKRNQQKP